MSVRVGFFDSGVGGLSILRAFKSICPEAETEYIGDSEHCPYGNRSREEIIALSEACVRKLLDRGCAMVVVACNTATAAAIDYLRLQYPHVPFVGLEPAIKPAALSTKTGVVSVLATAGTFNGRLYRETKARFAKDVTVIATVADEFVTEVEKLKGRDVSELSAKERVRLLGVVRAKIEPLVRAGADRIVLGCTHFPALKPLIAEVAGDGVRVIDPSPAVARQARRIYKTLCEARCPCKI